MIVELRMPAILEYRDLAGRAVSSVCRHAVACVCEGSDEVSSLTFTNELMSAVGEAFNNVVVHGYGNSGEGAVEMEIGWTRKSVCVKLRDTGRAFDFHKAPALDLDVTHESGMGIHIIRSFVDVAEYSPGPPNVLVLTKHLAVGKPRLEPAG